MVLYHLEDHGDFHILKDSQQIITGLEMVSLWHHFGATMISEEVEQCGMLYTVHLKEGPILKGKIF